MVALVEEAVMPDIELAGQSALLLATRYLLGRHTRAMPVTLALSLPATLAEKETLIATIIRVVLFFLAVGPGADHAHAVAPIVVESESIVSNQDH
jgi:hypothetical protein